MTNSFEIIKDDSYDDSKEYVYPSWVHQISDKKNLIDYEAYISCMGPAKIEDYDELNLVEKTLNNKFESFELGKPIGRGTYSISYLARMKDYPNVLVALKALNMKLEKFSVPLVYREVLNLSKIKNQNVIRIFDFFNDGHFFFIVTEYAPYGDLFDLMMRMYPFSEKQLAYIAQQMAFSIKACHDLNIAHRDIKIENIVVGKDSKLKLVDFGCSLDITNQKIINKAQGTLIFLAPEVIENDNHYGLEQDIWTFGTALFELICGEAPFGSNDDDINIIKENILKCNYKFDEYFSSYTKDLISKCLVYDPSKRIKIDEILDHKWFDYIYDQTN